MGAVDHAGGFSDGLWRDICTRADMAHDDTFQPDVDRSTDDTVQTAHVPTPGNAGSSAGGPTQTDDLDARPASPMTAGTAGVALGASGLPDRDALQESEDTGTGNLGAALQRDTGLGGTRGDDRSFERMRGEISGVGDTRGTGGGTGQSPSSSG